MRKSILFFSIALTAITLVFTACSSDNNDDTPSVADRVAGTYTGTDTLTIGGTYGPYETAGCRYVITSAGDSSVTLTNVFRIPMAVAKEYSVVPREAMVMLYTYRSSTSIVALFIGFWNTRY